MIVSSIQLISVPYIRCEKAISLIDEKIRSASRRALNAFEKAWSYIGKSALLTRHVLNTTIKSCAWFINRCGCPDPRFADSVRRLKFLALVSVPLTLKQLPAAIRKIGQNIAWKDGKEIILSSLSAAVLVADAVDSLATFATALLQTLSKQVPAAISAIGMPLSYGMLTVGSVTRIVRIWNTTRFARELDHGMLKPLADHTITPLQAHALISQFVAAQLPKEGREHSEAVFEKKSNNAALQTMKKMENLIEGELTQESIEEAKSLLSDILRQVKRERGFHGAYLAANMVSLTALAFFSFTIGIAAPYALLATGVAMRIGTQIYQDKTR